MPSLKKSATTGALLKNSSGALVDVCAVTAPCTDCNPNSGGSTPSNAVVAGVGSTAACLATNASYTFHRFIEGSSICEWQWRLTGTSLGNATFSLAYVKTSYSFFCVQTSSTVNLTAGEWEIRWTTSRASVESYQKKTTGFLCSASTGKVSGTDTIDLNTTGCGNNPRCDGFVSITVDP